MKAILASFFSLAALSISCSTQQKMPTTSPPATLQAEQELIPVQNKKLGLLPYRQGTLKNGLHVIAVEKTTLPSLSMGLLIKGGSSSDPIDRSGLTQFLVQLLEKGTVKKSAEQLAEEMGFLGAELNTDVTEDYAWVEINGLSTHSENLLELFSDMVLSPRFHESEIDRHKKVTLAAIQQIYDEPEIFAALAYKKYVFGNHPYGAPVSGTIKGVRSISRRDVMKHYLKIFRPQNMVLVVVGDIKKEVVDLIRQKFEPWGTGKKLEVKYPALEPTPGIQIRLIDQPQSNQGYIYFGYRSIKRTDPDYLTLKVANTILGGSFTSRLNTRIRDELGLTYNISSSFNAGMDFGEFSVTTFTKEDAVKKTLSESFEIHNRFLQDGVTPAEVEAAKNYLVGSFTRSVETPEKFGFNLAALRMYGIPNTYLTYFFSNVASISAEQVNAAIKRHFQKANLKLLVFGNASRILPQLESFGRVEAKKPADVF